MKLSAYSKALYSNWIYLEPLRLLLDAGEGVNNYLEGRLLGVQDLFLSHGHTDHFTGLHSLIGIRIREAVKSEQNILPLRIHYPAQSPTLELYFEYLSKSIYVWDKVVELCPMKVGDKVHLREHGNVVVTAFEARHNPRELCLGYRISNLRWKLKKEIQELPHEEFQRMVREKPKEFHSEQVEFPFITYSGDGKPMDDPESRGVELLIHEATFLDPDTSHVHSRLSEVIEVFRALEAKRLLLWHLSARYSPKDIRTSLEQWTTEEERERIDILFPGKYTQLSIPVSGM